MRAMAAAATAPAARGPGRAATAARSAATPSRRRGHAALTRAAAPTGEWRAGGGLQASGQAGPGALAPATAAALAASLARRPTQRRRRGRCRGRSALGDTAGSATQPLLEWLAGRGAEGVGSVRIGASGLARDSGSGVFAGRGLREGECVAAVPLGACLCAGQGVDLAARLLREQALGGDSAFAPYVRQLPQAEQLASHPLLWPAGAAAASLLAPCPQASRMVRHCRMRASQEAAALVQAGAAETEEGARWALAIVESRSITLGDGSPERPLALALCPLLDLLNHQVPRQGQPPSCTVRENRETGAVELVASGATSEGSELWLEYERCSTAQIFARYGFVQRYPEGDAAGPSCLLPVPVGDPRLPGGAEAAAERLRLLRADGWRRSAWRPLLLKMPDHARSTGSLMPVARLCALPSATAVRRFGPELLHGARFGARGLEAGAAELARAFLSEAQTSVEGAIEQAEAGGAAAGHPCSSARALLGAELGVLRRSRDILEAALAL